MKLSIDNPPLIIRKNIPNENNVKVMFESKVHNDALDRILNDSFSKISALEDSKSQMSEALKKVEYCKHRIDFIKRNLPILIKELKNVCVNIDKHIE